MKIYLILFIIIFIVLFVLFEKHTKHLKYGNLIMITGGVKTGKTTLSIHIIRKQYKKQLTKYYITKLFKKNVEKPLIYSNVPLALDYVPLTMDLLLGKERFTYGSIIYFQEASLLADSMSYRNNYVNEQLKYFNKLIAHETHGGFLIYDTQNVNDVHYNIDRAVSTYYWIYRKVHLPFFLLLKVREMINSGENTQNNLNNDVEEETKWLFVPTKNWRYFDSYSYSSITDNLPINKNIKKYKKGDSLKVTKVLTLDDIKGVKKYE